MADKPAAVGPLTYDVLRDAIANGAAAIRVKTRLQPAGGDGDKVFPPTYQGGQYAVEQRLMDGQNTWVVVLDSVQSQANRFEQALRHEREMGRLELPLIVSDFSDELPEIGQITALDAPHRIADAIFRDSELDGKLFLQTPLGERFTSAHVTNATALMELCPTALLFGVWDSTGPRGGMGAKFPRAIASEIVGYRAVPGWKTQSRIDPLPIAAGVALYQATDAQTYTADEEKARLEKGHPVPYGKNASTRGKPSAANLGNVTPDFARPSRRASNAPVDFPPQFYGEDQRGERLPGGVTIAEARQTAVLSLPALRRLRFPPAAGQPADRVAEQTTRTLLAALGLLAVACNHEQGHDLRSRCLLVPTEAPMYEVVATRDGSVTTYDLDAQEAREIYDLAVADVRAAGLPWHTEDIVLRPSHQLVDLVRKSMEVLAKEGEPS